MSFVNVAGESQGTVGRGPRIRRARDGDHNAFSEDAEDALADAHAHIASMQAELDAMAAKVESAEALAAYRGVQLQHLRSVLASMTRPQEAQDAPWNGDPAKLQLSQEQVTALTLARGQLPEVRRWLQSHGPRAHVEGGGSADSSRRPSLLDRHDERSDASVGGGSVPLAASASESSSHVVPSEQEDLGSIVAEVNQNQELLSRLRESITAKT